MTKTLDTAASVCQILFLAALCGIVSREREKLRMTPLVLASAVCILLYFAGWAFYYLGFTGLPVILALTVPPCLAFLFFALDRRNFIAVVPISIFTACHLIYGMANFI